MAFVHPTTQRSCWLLLSPLIISLTWRYLPAAGLSQRCHRQPERSGFPHCLPQPDSEQRTCRKLRQDSRRHQGRMGLPRPDTVAIDSVQLPCCAGGRRYARDRHDMVGRRKPRSVRLFGVQLPPAGGVDSFDLDGGLPSACEPAWNSRQEIDTGELAASPIVRFAMNAGAGRTRSRASLFGFPAVPNNQPALPACAQDAL
jgi:hypothetical protein